MLDHFHAAGVDVRAGSSITEWLVGLIHTEPRLRVVIATRNGLGPHILSSTETRTVGASDLAFTEDETRALARAYGLELSDDGAARVIAHLGGWPALVVRTLRQLALDPDVHGLDDAIRATESDFHAWLLEDPTDSRRRQLLGNLSVAERLTAGAARFLTGDPDVAMRLDDLTRQGLLLRQLDPVYNEAVFRFTPNARRLALAASRRDSQPADAERAAALARWFRDKGQAMYALVQASAIQDWAFVAELFEQSWTELVNADQPLLVRALKHLPEAAVVGFPRAHAVRHIVLGSVMDTEDLPPVPSRSYLQIADLARRAGVINAVEIAMAELIALRRSGRFREAARQAAMADHLAKIVGPRIPERILPLVPMARFQTALTFELAGQADAAAEQLSLSLVALEALAEVNLSERNQITGLLAAKAAIAGDLGAAETWGEREVLHVRPERWIWLMPNLLTSHRVARATTAVDRLDRHAAETHLAPLQHLETRDELWAMIAWAQARFDLLWTSPERSLRSLDDSTRRHHLWHNGESAADSLLLGASVDLLLAAGQANRAAALVASADTKQPVIQVARARISHLTGGSADAIGLLRTVLRTRSIPDRVRLEALVLSAQAVVRVDGIRASLPTWVEAHDLADGLGSPLAAFAAADPEMFGDVAELDPALGLTREACLDHYPKQVFPSRVAALLLTERELAILRQLQDGASLTAIARRHYVTQSTVKSQVRSLYAKLDVHSRGEAVAAGEELGLLDI